MRILETGSESASLDAAAGGVESVKRALQLLTVLAAHNDGGARLSDLCGTTGLSQGTVHRLLRTLASCNFAEQDHSTRRYYLGNAFLALGSSVANRMNSHEAAVPALQRVSTMTGDTVVMMIRSGLDAVCNFRVEGTYPIKTLTMKVGTARPLGFGGGSLVLLAFSPDSEREDLIKRVSYRSADFPCLEFKYLHSMVDQARSQGYVFLEGHILKSMATLALPVLDAAGNLHAAISIVGTLDRLAQPRRNELLALMRQAAHTIGTEISSLPARARA